jgi:hypothetical protein
LHAERTDCAAIERLALICGGILGILIYYKINQGQSHAVVDLVGQVRARSITPPVAVHGACAGAAPGKSTGEAARNV